VLIPRDKPLFILFDLDGTLIDSTEAILDSFRRSFRELGGSYPGDEAVKGLVGHPLAEMYRSFGVPEERVEEYVVRYKERYRQVHTLKTVLLPGAREAVELAASFARLGVVTTKTGKYSRELLEHFGLMEHFEVLIGSEDVTRHKPHPEPVLTALERMGARPQHAWMIGDTCLDVEAALAAGTVPLGVCCGTACEADLRRCGAQTYPDSYTAVEKLLSEF
jgi:phosphoglycolate phosphatase